MAEPTTRKNQAAANLKSSPGKAFYLNKGFVECPHGVILMKENSLLD